MTEATLVRARTGDADAFRELIDPYRGELRLHCYRIATNRCLNAIRDARRRVPTEPTPPFTPPEPTRRGEATWLQPYPDTLLDRRLDTEPDPAARYQSREAVELAFIAALQVLPPRQTATLVLRDVLGYSTAETADMLDTTETAIKGALQRARAALDTHYGSANPPRGGSVQERNLAQRFADAFTADDIDGVIALLTDNAWLRMPPAPHEYHGPEAIAAFLRTSATWRDGRRFRLIPTRANTQPAFGWYLPDLSQPIARPIGLIVLTPELDRIRGVTHFLDSDLPPRFGLPEAVDSPIRRGYSGNE